MTRETDAGRSASADSALRTTKKKKGGDHPPPTFGTEKVPTHRSSAELRNVTSNSKIPRRLAPLEHIKILYKGAAKKQDSKATIHEKKDLMRLVRQIHARRNKPQRKLVLSELAKTSEVNASRLSTKLDLAKQERRSLEAAVNINARKFNTLTDSVARDKLQIQTMLDALALIERDVKALRAAEKASTAETLRIEELRVLVADTDKKINVELFKKAQLTHMSRRLRHNLVAYESHINDLNLAIEASGREIAEVEVLLKQLEMRKAESEKAMEDTKMEITNQTKSREEELAALREEVDRAERMVEWREERQRHKLLARSEAEGDLDERGELALMSQSRQLELRDKSLQAASKSTLDKEITMEEAFMQIRRATGINTLEEMVEKFLGQTANKEALEQEKHEAEEHLVLVRQKLAEAEAAFSDLRASGIGNGSGGTEFSRDAYDQLDEEITKLKADLKYSTQACKRLENVQVSCRLGALGLAQRLAPLTNLLDADEEAAIASTGIESLDALVRCQKKVAKMIELIQLKGQDGSSSSLSLSSSFSSSSSSATATAAPASTGAGDATSPTGGAGGVAAREETADGVAAGGADGADEGGDEPGAGSAMGGDGSDGGGNDDDDAVLNGNRPHINNIRVQTLDQQRKNDELQPVAKPDLIAAVVGGQDGAGGDEDDDSDGDEVLDVAQLRAMMKADAALIASGKKKVKAPPNKPGKKGAGAGVAGGAGAGAAAAGGEGAGAAQPDMA